MRVPVLAAILFGAATISTSAMAQETKHDHQHPTAPPSAALKPFKALAGDWVGKMEEDPSGEEKVTNYKVTSNGSTVVETMCVGTPMEMVTIIHSDGDDLVLTHYCAIGNQPKMKTSGKSQEGKAEFKFVSATNLKSDKDMHMHDVTFHFIDKDTLKIVWTNYDQGKAAGLATINLKRKK